MAIPPVEALNRLPADEFASAVAPLLESASAFAHALAEARPFASDAELLATAREVAHRLPEADRVALLDAHPRIGAVGPDLSELSRAEQGSAADEPGWIGEELESLNGVYEARFGFRFVVFVAGRPRAEIIPLLEAAIHADREAEMRRGVDDALYIAGDRLARLRQGGG